MNDQAGKLANTEKALRLLSSALVTAAELTAAALSIQATISKARAENREISDEELEAARSQSALADLRFQQAVAAVKA